MFVKTNLGYLSQITLKNIQLLVLIMKIPKMENLFIDKCPPTLGTYSNKSPPPGQKLGCKSRRVGANFLVQIPRGVQGGGHYGKN